MKIRKHRKREWWFFPTEESKLYIGRCYIFKYKHDLMKFLNRKLCEVLNGVVSLEEKSFSGVYCLKHFRVGFNKNKIIFKKMEIRKPILYKTSKRSKRYFAFSDKVINLMTHIGHNEEITPASARNLVNLFKKRGFVDFEPTEDDWKYINGHISDGIDFFHWSDRCNWLRSKTIIEYFKRSKLI